MTDLALVWDTDSFAGDLLLQDGQLATDDGLRTAILISLFTDARAADDEALPEAGDDRRGWWGDAVASGSGPASGSAEDQNRIGSLLWLLGRSKMTPQVLRRAHVACDDALQWLIRDGVAAAIRVVVTAKPNNMLAFSIELDRPAGPTRQRFDFTWDASTGALITHPHVEEPA